MPAERRSFVRRTPVIVLVLILILLSSFVYHLLSSFIFHLSSWGTRQRGRPRRRRRRRCVGWWWWWRWRVGERGRGRAWTGSYCLGICPRGVIWRRKRGRREGEAEHGGTVRFLRGRREHVGFLIGFDVLFRGLRVGFGVCGSGFFFGASRCGRHVGLGLG